MIFNIEGLSGDWKAEYGERYAAVTKGVNRYRPNSVVFGPDDDGFPCIKRNYLKGNVGAGPNNPPDFWYLRAYFDEPVESATDTIWMYFPVGFFSKTKKGKLPLSFQSRGINLDDRGTEDMQTFERNAQPDEFSSHTMYWTNRDASGNDIPMKALDPNRNTARVGGYIYGKHINRPNKKKGVPCPVKDFVLTEGEWIGARQIVELNQEGVANGTLRYFFTSSLTGGKWKEFPLMFPLNGSSQVDGQVLSWDTLEWVAKDKILCANKSWFMGGGNAGLSMNGADGPDEDVYMLSAGWETLPGIHLPEGLADAPVPEPDPIPNPVPDDRDATIKELTRQLEVADLKNQLLEIKIESIEAERASMELKLEDLYSSVGSVVELLETLKRKLL